MIPGPRSRSNSFVPINGYREAVETAKGHMRKQQDALRAIAFYRRRKRSAGAGWLVTTADRKRSLSG